MQADVNVKHPFVPIDLIDIQDQQLLTLQEVIAQAWQIIAPAWPIQHLIAVNPLQGLENLPFEQALTQAFFYFKHMSQPQPMGEVNRETIKWCQAFFDAGQATVAMPYRHLGFYQAFRKLAPFDAKLIHIKVENDWLANLPDQAEEAMVHCLTTLMIPVEKRALFLSLILTTLPGWAGYIKYRTAWAKHDKSDYPVSQVDYLAVRLILTAILWPQAVNLLKMDEQFDKNVVSEKIKHIHAMEEAYRKPLFATLACHAQAMTANKMDKYEKPIAQLVFCIDVRSEPLRRAIETQGNYETFGFAGFFGIPVQIENDLLGESKVVCPVLLQPKHKVKEVVDDADDYSRQVVKRIKLIHTVKRVYQALKYNFTTPLTLVEVVGWWSGLSMLLKTIFPESVMRLKEKIVERTELMSIFNLSLIESTGKIGIALKDQCVYAENVLRLMGLTENFSPLVVLCGHASSTQNNAYATALECGACGANPGGNNAKILATILNSRAVRCCLIASGINIPPETSFIAAEHNTTTDEVLLYLTHTIDSELKKNLDQLTLDLKAATKITNQYRYSQFVSHKNKKNLEKCSSFIKKRSNDWAQTRPEWGLSRNAALIIGPRKLTKQINLEGRVFLHSFDWQTDTEGALLATILTAPMIVAQWINSQYFFSSLDNIAFGSGSKITHNVTGKIGIIQGNSSDLMNGLPLQSLFSRDSKRYHETLRLLTIVYAPRRWISQIIAAQSVLQKLFGNGWVMLACIEPEEKCIYYLDRNLMWHIDNEMTTK